MMESKFWPAVAAIKAGDIDRLKSLISDDPSLATARSSSSHPTLLQCLVLDGANLPSKIELAQVLIENGADINGALAAAASIDNVEAAEALLDSGAKVDGTGGWTPLEEALYWCNHRVGNLLLERGASVNHNAALHGHREMVAFLLEQGANPNIKDTKVNNTAASWADYGGHHSLRDFLLEQT